MDNSSKKKIKIFNGQIITPYRMIKSGTLILEGEKILGVEHKNTEVPDAIEIDAKGQYVTPGFIDMHVHGGGGYDFMDGTEEAFLGIAEIHAIHGTTAMLPTTLTSEVEDLFTVLEAYDSVMSKNEKGAQFLGMHLEGPYFSLEQKGAQDPRYIRNPDPGEYKKIMQYAHHLKSHHHNIIKRWSAAPELDGAIDFARYLKSNDVLVALAHTNANYDEALLGFENGYSLATHFYSCMAGVTRKNALRYAGTIEAGYLIDEMDVEIIADGVHLPAPLLKMIYKIKGVDRIALITDAIRAAGLPPGESIIGSLKNGLRVIVEDGVAKLPDRSSFAGSVATTDRLVRTMVQIAEVPIVDAVQMATHTPARILGVDKNKGALLPGMDADILIFNNNIDIDKTIIKGRVVYER